MFYLRFSHLFKVCVCLWYLGHTGLLSKLAFSPFILFKKLIMIVIIKHLKFCFNSPCQMFCSFISLLTRDNFWPSLNLSFVSLRNQILVTFLKGFVASFRIQREQQTYPTLTFLNVYTSMGWFQGHPSVCLVENNKLNFSIFNLTLLFFLNTTWLLCVLLSKCQFYLTGLFLFVLEYLCCLQQCFKSIFAVNFLGSSCILVRSPFRVSFCHTNGNRIPLWGIFKGLVISDNLYLNIWS